MRAMIGENIGERIAVLRKERGLSQTVLARELGVSHSAIGMYEQGRREPGVEMLVRIAQLFQVSLDFLITGREYSGCPEKKTEKTRAI